MAAKEVVLAEHQPLRPDALVRRGEPVVPDERHPLDERSARAHHPVEPPEVVVAPGVGRRDRVPVVVLGRVPDEPLALRMGQQANGAVEAFLRERLGLARSRPETGTPEQALGLSRAEAASINGNVACGSRQRRNPAVFIGKNPG